MNYKIEEFIARDGSAYKVNIPIKNTDIKSFFLFSLHKCGSTLLNNIFTRVCNRRNIPIIDINKDTFSHGVPFRYISKDIEKIILEYGYAYLGFRSYFPFIPDFDFSGNKKILLVRNPKDALVSLFFSIKYSHTIPEKGRLNTTIKNKRIELENMTIDEFAIATADKINKQFERYLLLPNKNLKIYRYEDIIYEKISWVENMCSYLNLEINKSEIEVIVSEYDIIPESENKNEHIRQVHPGNYKKHLSEKTNAYLNKIFSVINKKYGYCE